MEVLLLLTLFAVSGFSYVLEPKLTHSQITGTDKDQTTELRSTRLRDAFISEDEKGNRKKTVAAEMSEDKPVLETNSVKEHIKDNVTEKDRRSEGSQTQEASEEQMRMDRILTSLAETKRFEEIMDIDQWYERVTEDRLTPEAEKMGDIRKSEMENEGGRVLKETFVEGINNSSKLETAHSHNSVTQLENRDQKDNLLPRIVQEEQDSMLMAGIQLVVRTGDTHEDKQNIFTVRQENETENVEKAEKGEKVNNARHELSEKEEVGVLIAPLSTFSSHVTKMINHSQILYVSPPHHHHVPPIPAITPTQPPSVSSVAPLFLPSSVAPLRRINTSYVSLAAGGVKSVSLVEDLIIEVLQSLESKLNKLELKAKLNLEDVTVKNIQENPGRKEVQTTYKEDDTRDINTTIQPKEIPFNSQEQVATPKPIEAQFVTAHFRPAHMLIQTTVSPKLKENNLPANLAHKPDTTQPAAQNKTLKLTQNKIKRIQKKTKVSPPKPQQTKPSAKRERHNPNGKMQTKINRSSKNKTIKKTEETKKKKDNRTHKPSKEPKYFPDFMDPNCPPECVCYGRVVQCSDKGLENIPHGIPYNACYILLMNNRINSIRLDALNAYISMEFLVLSNNHLTDGAIKGVFVGVSALKRLYLDKNLLESIPTDLPVSLEELHLDDNRLRMMSEVAWVRCPSLLVLSLCNNSLGNGSQSLPDAVLSPLRSLRTLNLDHNQLISVPLGLPLSIKELYLKGNLIEQFRRGAFNGLSELVLLDLSANRLTNKGLLRESLLNTTHLESLNLEGNKLKQVPRHLPLSLKALNLEGNLITSIKKAAFRPFRNLEHLGLARNKIFKVAAGAFGTLPVLHQLDLCYNTLRQVPRQLPQSLHSVALTHNKIQSVPRDAFCWGNKSLSLSGLAHVQLENNFIDLGTLDTQAFRCLRGFQVVHFY